MIFIYNHQPQYLLIDLFGIRTSSFTVLLTNPFKSLASQLRKVVNIFKQTPCTLSPSGAFH